MSGGEDPYAAHGSGRFRPCRAGGASVRRGEAVRADQSTGYGCARRASAGECDDALTVWVGCGSTDRPHTRSVRPTPSHWASGASRRVSRGHAMACGLPSIRLPHHPSPRHPRNMAPIGAWVGGCTASVRAARHREGHHEGSVKRDLLADRFSSARRLVIRSVPSTRARIGSGRRESPAPRC